MIKKILLLIAMLALIVYLVVAITAFNNKPHYQTCNDLELTIKDTINAGFINKGELKNILQQQGIYPIGKKMDLISTKYLEIVLEKYPLIDQAECYKTPSGKVCIEVTQRFPLLRIMADNGDNYYIDNKGSIMPPEAKCIAHRVVITGNVEKYFAKSNLYKFGLYLQNNKFWDAQIEQINVLPDKDVELVPRVGNHVIFLGKLDDFEQKLGRLKTFYTKGLNQVGWNKYSRISLEFKNQIICSKPVKDTLAVTVSQPIETTEGASATAPIDNKKDKKIKKD